MGVAQLPLLAEFSSAAHGGFAASCGAPAHANGTTSRTNPASQRVRVDFWGGFTVPLGYGVRPEPLGEPHHPGWVVSSHSPSLRVGYLIFPRRGAACRARFGVRRLDAALFTLPEEESRRVIPGGAAIPGCEPLASHLRCHPEESSTKDLLFRSPVGPPLLRLDTSRRAFGLLRRGAACRARFGVRWLDAALFTLREEGSRRVILGGAAIPGCEAFASRHFEARFRSAP